MLTVADIPDEYRKGETDGENIARLASGVQAAIHESLGDEEAHALLRFVQAGFLFRSSEIGLAMVHRSSFLYEALGETTQLVNFAGASLAASTLVAAVDLTAAALHRLYVGPVSPADPGREADVEHFPGRKALPPEGKSWLAETKDSIGWEVLKQVRDQFTHRWFPMHVTVQLGSPMAGILHHVEIAAQKKSIPEFLQESRTFVIDRLVSAGLVMDRHAKQAAT